MNLVKKLSLMLLIPIWIAEFLTRAQCNEMDECCYSYASVPRNDTFCVSKGEQVDLHCIIINPHDSFTNLTVTWFRSTTEDMSVFDEISATSNEYRSSNFNSNAVNSLSVNCSHEVYRDTFLLIINHFTRHKNGYYWCQLFINDTLVQPSYRAQFYLGECQVTNYHSGYYRLANSSENQCAEYIATESDAGSITTYESSGTSSIAASRESSTRSSSVTQQERESDKPIIIYVAGSLSALLLIMGVLALVLLFTFYVHHQTKKTSTEHQCEVCTSELENQEYDDICAGKTTALEEEGHVYQTLKLNEMNYESMYSKIVPTKK